MMNHRNPAIKRIMADVRELHRHPSSRYHAAPLESDMFEWHFTIRGPEDTPFAGGIYHGRIILPPEYPFKPPNFVFLTKNGRFEVGTKICLSISAFHEESWQPAWGVRTMLEAIISFMPTEGAGAIGALDWTAEERKKLALESQSFVCPTCGNIASLLCEPTSTEKDTPDPTIVDQIAQLHLTRQPPSLESFSVGDLSCGISATNSVISAISHPHDDQSTVMSDITGTSMTWYGTSALSEATFASVTTTTITAEEDVSTTVLHQAALNSSENDPDNDCTLQQMINMKMDRCCASPPMTRVSNNNPNNKNSSNNCNNSHQSSPNKLPATAATTTPEPFTTETLADIRKKRIAEKQQLLFQQAQQISQSPVMDTVSTHIFPAGTTADTVAYAPRIPICPAHSLTVTEPGTIVNEDDDKDDGNISNNNVVVNYSLQPTEQHTPPPQQAHPQPVPPPPQPPLLQLLRQFETVAEAQRRRNLDRQNFNRIHWILNTLLVGTAGAIVGVIMKILVRSAEISSQPT